MVNGEWCLVIVLWLYKRRSGCVCVSARCVLRCGLTFWFVTQGRFVFFFPTSSLSQCFAFIAIFRFSYFVPSIFVHCWVNWSWLKLTTQERSEWQIYMDRRRDFYPIERIWMNEWMNELNGIQLFGVFICSLCIWVCTIVIDSSTFSDGPAFLFRSLPSVFATKLYYCSPYQWLFGRWMVDNVNLERILVDFGCMQKMNSSSICIIILSERIFIHGQQKRIEANMFKGKDIWKQTFI